MNIFQRAIHLVWLVALLAMSRPQTVLQNLIMGNGLTPQADAARNFLQERFDPVVSLMNPEQGTHYAGGWFVGNVAPNFIPIGGLEKGGATVLGRAMESLVQRIPGLGTDLGQLATCTLGRMGMWFERFGAENTVTRYVGATEARIAEETGFIPNVDRFGQPKVVYVTPEAPVASVSQAEGIYQIGRTNPMGATAPPTHVIVGNPQGINFISGGNVAGSTQLGTELLTTERIPIISVRPIGGN